MKKYLRGALLFGFILITGGLLMPSEAEAQFWRLGRRCCRPVNYCCQINPCQYGYYGGAYYQGGYVSAIPSGYPGSSCCGPAYTGFRVHGGVMYHGSVHGGHAHGNVYTGVQGENEGMIHRGEWNQNPSPNQGVNPPVQEQKSSDSFKPPVGRDDPNMPGYQPEPPPGIQPKR